MRGIKTRIIESLRELGNAIYADLGGDIRIKIDDARKPRVVTYDNVTGALTIDWDNCDEARLNLIGNTVVTFSGGVDGQKLMLRTTQDSTGSRLMSLSSNVRYNADVPTVVLTTTANKTDRIGFIFDSTLGKYDVVAVAKGY